MSEHLHPGLHLDADSLNAFMEGVLPEHERLHCLAHLADCERCREIVYLAQEPIASGEPDTVPSSVDPAPFWKRWFTPLPVLAAAAACVLLLSIGVYRLHKPETQAPILTAAARAPVESSPASEPAAQTPAPQPAEPIAARASAPASDRRARIENAEKVEKPAPAAAPVAVAPPPPPASPAPPPPPPPAASAAREATLLKTESGALANSQARSVTSEIAGIVTDAAGGVVPGARVTARSLTGTSSIDTRTDRNGQYNLTGLAPGQYQVQFLSPGFKQEIKQIDLQPQQIAKADSTLQVGAATDTVTITAEAPALNTESASVSASRLKKSRSAEAEVSTLPSRLPASTTASTDKLMLAADSSGTLFLSKNAGKSWKAVKPRWQGKVVRLVLTPEQGAMFQLTTDTNAVWLSRDGTHWNSAPAPR